MDLGLSKEEIKEAFNKAIGDNIEDLRASRQRIDDTLLGKYPLEESAIFEAILDAKDKLKSVENKDLIPLLILTILDVIKANNKRKAEDIEFLLK